MGAWTSAFTTGISNL